MLSPPHYSLSLHFYISHFYLPSSLSCSRFRLNPVLSRSRVLFSFALSFSSVLFSFVCALVFVSISFSFLVLFSLSFRCRFRFHFISISIQFQFHFISISFQFQFNFNFISFQFHFNFNFISISIPISTSISSIPFLIHFILFILMLSISTASRFVLVFVLALHSCLFIYCCCAHSGRCHFFTGLNSIGKALPLARLFSGLAASVTFASVLLVAHTALRPRVETPLPDSAFGLSSSSSSFSELLTLPS